MKRQRPPFGPLNQCEHLRMRWCCWSNGKPCGHLECPDCGLTYDIANDWFFERRYADGKWMLWL